MKKALEREWLRSYGTNITLDEDYMTYDQLKLKTGFLSGTMRINEARFNSIPYKAMVFNRPVLVSFRQAASLSKMWREGTQTFCVPGDHHHQEDVRQSRHYGSRRQER